MDIDDQYRYSASCIRFLNDTITHYFLVAAGRQDGGDYTLEGHQDVGARLMVSARLKDLVLVQKVVQDLVQDLEQDLEQDLVQDFMQDIEQDLVQDRNRVTVVLQGWCYRVGVTGLVLQGWCYRVGVTGLVLQGWCYRVGVTGLVLGL
eukprot:scaffold2032_cov158-Skeletonema_menzelii.AAC.2